MTPASRLGRRGAAMRDLLTCARRIASNATQGIWPTDDDAAELHDLECRYEALDLACLGDLIPDRPDPDQLVIPLVCAPVLVCGECSENNCDNMIEGE